MRPLCGPFRILGIQKGLTLTIFRQNHFPGVQKYQQIFGDNFLIFGTEVICYLYAFFSPKCLVLGHFLIVVVVDRGG